MTAIGSVDSKCSAETGVYADEPVCARVSLIGRRIVFAAALVVTVGHFPPRCLRVDICHQLQFRLRDRLYAKRERRGRAILRGKHANVVNHTLAVRGVRAAWGL